MLDKETYALAVEPYIRKNKMEECLGFQLKCSGNDNRLFMIMLNHYEKLKIHQSGKICQILWNCN
ncbi:hypothetical protein [Acetobacterium sp.]|jgi:carbohydrate diacid regulator|uniref:hypothetical protein n=1 Tax=Acetobacterium sp. TaxID=1872094 RepID=UPI002718700C|nr:hypothetical protein [Acetobacterium sp.]MDO9491205.1 hypothetical protein [Acetobacterium sp.]